MSKQVTQWLPLYKLPIFSSLVDNILQDTKKMYSLFSQAEEKPWVLDDATVNRTIRLYQERMEIIDDHLEQIAKWRKEKLTAYQKQEIDRLETATGETKKLTQAILDLANNIKANTIDQILARDEGELALDVLMGKLKI
jgi:HD superfamily phosphohydrolase